MKITGKDYIVHRINLLAKLPVNAVLVDKLRLQLTSNEDAFDVPMDVAQTMFNTKGKKLLKTNLSVLFNTDNEGESHFKARVLSILDYGEYQYARVDYQGNAFYVVNKDYNIGEEVDVNLNLADSLITDEDNRMILVGNQPNRLQAINNAR